VNETVRIVRVAIPCYNYGRFLSTCVGTILAQQGVEVQVLIIDDASRDNSQQVAAGLASSDSRVRVRTHATNIGHLRTYNEGLEWTAEAPFTVLISPDDALTPGALQRACDLFEAHPEVGLVYGNARVFRGEGPLPQADLSPPRWNISRGFDWFTTRCERAGNCISSPEAVMRSSVLQRAAFYRLDLPHSGDFELWMRMALHGDVAFIDGPHQAYYRDHGLGMHRVDFGTPLADLTEVKKAFDVLFQHHRAQIPGCDRLKEVVKRRIAVRALKAARKLLHHTPRDRAAIEALQQFAIANCGDIRELPEYREFIADKMKPALVNMRSAQKPR